MGSKNQVLSDMILTAMSRVIGMMDATGRIATVHGFRNSFRNFCGETGALFDLAEQAPAQAAGVGNSVVAAYARSDLLGRRRDVMEAWAAHCYPSTTDDSTASFGEEAAQ